MHYDALIVGAGPGGLACATRLAQYNLKVLVIDRKSVIGPKSCAGGITWNGLIQRVPETLVERAFSSQYIYTRYQKYIVKEEHPILATVNRKKLGQHLALEARERGVDIARPILLEEISSQSARLLNLSTQKRFSVRFDFLIGADGATSVVRKYLNIPVEHKGVGVDFRVDGNYEHMEWHLLSNYFHCGYGWIFPHKESFSIGAYVPYGVMSGSALKNRTVEWAGGLGINLERVKCSAGFINFDYRGYEFDRVYLVGDAAGFASALTGEGIFPAIVSGESVAEKIIHPQKRIPEMERLIKQQIRFRKMTAVNAKGRLISTFLAELGVLTLRSRLVDFRIFEMC